MVTNVSIGFVALLREVIVGRTLERRFSMSCESLVKFQIRKKKLFDELSQVYFLMKSWRKIGKDWPISVRKMLDSLLSEIHTDTFLELERSQGNFQNAPHDNDKKSTGTIKGNFVMMLFAQRARLRELACRYKREKVEHMQTLVDCVYLQEVQETISREQHFMCSQYGNYFQQPLLFRLSPEFGRRV